MVAVAAEKITVTQDLYPQQFAFLHDHRRYPAFIGGRNSGKTFTGAYKAFAQMSRRDNLGLVAGPSFPAMKLGPKPRLLAVLDAAGVYYVENKNENTLYVPGLNAGVQFAGLENDTYTRGPNYSWGWIDELDFVTNPEMYKTAKASVRDGTDYQLFSTSTPKGQYIIYREWVLEADDFHRLYKASTHDNFFVDADSFVSGLGYVGDFYEQEINAEFVKLEGLVYPGFDRMRQIREVDCADWPCALGLDSGLHITALLTMRYSGDYFHVEQELYRGNMSNGDIVDAVYEEYVRTNAAFVVFDPAAGNLGLDLQRKGMHVRKADKTSVKDGIQRVVGMLPGLSVEPTCRHFIAEIEAYQYPPNSEKDQPIKANDHLMDALRYLAMELTKPKKVARVW